MKRKSLAVICMLLVIALAASMLCGCEKDKERKFKDKVEVDGYGLHVSKSGWITLDGKPFYGIGLVWKDAFKMKLGNPSTDLEPYFAKLKEGGIPFVRIMFGADDKETVLKYINSKDEYLAAMDSVVQTAEKYQIGIVADLFWNMQAVSDAFNENLKQLTKETESASANFAKSYADEIVARYKDSTSLWAWEITNEGNLMCEAKRFDVVYIDGSVYKTNFTTDMLTSFYEYISNEIRAVDSYRMIVNGDASPRFFSKALRENFYTAPWDTDEDMKETFELYSSGSIDCLSVHTPYISFLAKYKNCADELCRGLYVGAFCGTLYTNPDESKTPEEDVLEANERESFNAYLDSYMENGVQMASAMNFASYAVDQKDDASIEVGTTEGVYRNTYAWDRIVSENGRLVSEGKNNAAAYWESVK